MLHEHGVRPAGSTFVSERALRLFPTFSPKAMRPSSHSTLAQLILWAKEHDLLDNHRFLDRFLYLELGEQRFVFDDQMARTFLMGLLAAYTRQHPS